LRDYAVRKTFSLFFSERKYSPPGNRLVAALIGSVVAGLPLYFVFKAMMRGEQARNGVGLEALGGPKIAARVVPKT
jgi:hypothetical protein